MFPNLHNQGRAALTFGDQRESFFNDTSVESLGRRELRGVTTTGRVQILARDRVRGGRVNVDGLNILAADARAERDRPHGCGVYVLQGAFTFRNAHPDEAVVTSA